MDIWAVSTLWLLWMLLLWTSVYIYLPEPLFLTLWGIQLAVELLSHVIILCLTYWGTQTFPLWLHISHFYQQCMSVPVTPHPCHQHLNSVFISALLVSMKWFLIVVLILISELYWHQVNWNLYPPLFPLRLCIRLVLYLFLTYLFISEPIWPRVSLWEGFKLWIQFL